MVVSIVLVGTLPVEMLFHRFLIDPQISRYDGHTLRTGNGTHRITCLLRNVRFRTTAITFPMFLHGDQ